MRRFRRNANLHFRRPDREARAERWDVPIIEGWATNVGNA